MDGGRAGDARRRRDRRLWAWHRHVKLTVAMELATALHHSAQPAGPVVEGPSEGGARDVRRSTETGGTSPGEAAGAAV